MFIVLDDDDLYLNWVNQNPDGFVINASRKPAASYLKLHRATCHSLNKQNVLNWTTGDYLKACSLESQELVQWSEHWFKTKPDDCSFCMKVNSAFRTESSFETRFSDAERVPFEKYPEMGRVPMGPIAGVNARRGYTLKLHQLTGLRECAYCGFDLMASFENWLTVQLDHVVPVSAAKMFAIQDDWIQDYSNTVLACSACNSYGNRYKLAEAPSLDSREDFYNLRDQVYQARRKLICALRDDERTFFNSLKSS